MASLGGYAKAEVTSVEQSLAAGNFPEAGDGEGIGKLA